MQTAWIWMRLPVTWHLTWIQAVWHSNYIFSNFEVLCSFAYLLTKLSLYLYTPYREPWILQDSRHLELCWGLHPCLLILIIVTYANSLNPDETASNFASHLDTSCWTLELHFHQLWGTLQLCLPSIKTFTISLYSLSRAVNIAGFPSLRTMLGSTPLSSSILSNWKDKTNCSYNQ